MSEQFLLPGMPCELSSPAELDWNQKLQLFMRIGVDRGGLIPQAILPDLLGVSRQRVSELVLSGRLEKVNFFGTPFVTGRSIEEHKTAEKLKGGYGVKRLSFWKKLSVGTGLGNAIATAITSEN